MAKNHGVKQQKKLAKQKAKRAEKRASLARRDSLDPTVRLANVDKWPVYRALASTPLWERGIGEVVLARQEAGGSLLIGVYLVDVFCLGVKNAFWTVGSVETLSKLVARIERNTPLQPAPPEDLVKLVEGSVAYARELGFAPHGDYRHASKLFAGIDPSTSRAEFTFGKDGRPLYMQGPHETPAQIAAILERVREAGGHYMIGEAGQIGDSSLAFEPLDEEFDDEDDPPALEGD